MSWLLVQMRLGTNETKAESDSTWIRKFSSVVSVCVELRVNVAPPVTMISVKLLHDTCNDRARKKRCVGTRGRTHGMLSEAI